MFDGYDDVGAMAAQGITLTRDTGRTEYDRMNLSSALRIGGLARRSHRFQSDLPERAFARFREREKRSHHKTLASD
jgi:hypothetical protein